MILGFTGTQHGMTNAQQEGVRELFRTLPLTVLHHGCCIGSDVQAHRMAFMCARIIGHPPSDAKKKGYIPIEQFDELRPQFGYMVRNYHIVHDGVDGLIATQKDVYEVLRSGTWSTIRRARKNHRRIWIVRPDGVVSEERS